MGRTLAVGTICGMCQLDAVVLVEKSRLITRRDLGLERTAEDLEYLMRTWDGLRVAEAICVACGTRYLAWVDASNIAEPGLVPPYSHESGKEFCALSYRSTFNNDPSDEDLPTHRVVSWSELTVSAGEGCEVVVLPVRVVDGWQTITAVVRSPVEQDE